MKVAWILIIIGSILLLEGTWRIAWGLAIEYYLLSFGGFLTGWLLGGLLLKKGCKRLKLIKAKGVNNDNC